MYSNAYKQQAHTHTCSHARKIIVTHTVTHACKDIYKHIYKDAHTPHGVGNMSEQSIIWHLNQSLLLEVWRNAAGKICLDDKQHRNSFSPLTALKVKETYIFPKHWLVHVERFHCTVLHLCVVVPCFYPRLCKIWKGTPQSKAFLLWLFFSCCIVTVKATGKIVVTQQVFTWKTEQIWLCKSNQLQWKYTFKTFPGGEIKHRLMQSQ